jgi:phage antirepressor YoqD-like protein
MCTLNGYKNMPHKEIIKSIGEFECVYKNLVELYDETEKYDWLVFSRKFFEFILKNKILIRKLKNKEIYMDEYYREVKKVGKIQDKMKGVHLVQEGGTFVN